MLDYFNFPSQSYSTYHKPIQTGFNPTINIKTKTKKNETKAVVNFVTRQELLKLSHQHFNQNQSVYEALPISRSYRTYINQTSDSNTRTSNPSDAKTSTSTTSKRRPLSNHLTKTNVDRDRTTFDDEIIELAQDDGHLSIQTIVARMGYEWEEEEEDATLDHDNFQPISTVELAPNQSTSPTTSTSTSSYGENGQSSKLKIQPSESVALQVNPDNPNPRQLVLHKQVNHVKDIFQITLRKSSYEYVKNNSPIHFQLPKVSRSKNSLSNLRLQSNQIQLDQQTFKNDNLPNFNSPLNPRSHNPIINNDFDRPSPNHSKPLRFQNHRSSITSPVTDDSHHTFDPTQHNSQSQLRILPRISIPSGGFIPNQDPSRITKTIFNPNSNFNMFTISLDPKRKKPLSNMLIYSNLSNHPKHLGTGQVLIEIDSVGLDAWDLALTQSKVSSHKVTSSNSNQQSQNRVSTKAIIHDFNLSANEYQALESNPSLKSKPSNGNLHSNFNQFVPGRSFVGKVLEVGLGVKRLKKGDLVYGLQDLKKSGALAQQIVIDKDLVAIAPVHPNLSMEQIACLPTLGVPSYFVMSTICAGLPKGSKILILNGHKGLGAMMCEFVKYFRPNRDLWVTCHIPTVATSVEEIGITIGRCELRGAREVMVEDSVLSSLNSIHESSYDVVIDTVGGRRIYDASRRILHHEGMFISCVGDRLRMRNLKDKVRTNFRSLRRTFIKKDQKKIGYWCLSPETEYDGQRQTIREGLDEIRKIIEDDDDCFRLVEDLQPHELQQAGGLIRGHQHRFGSQDGLANSVCNLSPVIGTIIEFEEGFKAFNRSARFKNLAPSLIIEGKV
ncbi:hypothetical protein DFH28DRAFT_897067 [Melampsora americana]|nr:hypothetical protein DFH28DRAFT_897067 [Melampsora americana]